MCVLQFCPVYCSFAQFRDLQQIEISRVYFANYFPRELLNSFQKQFPPKFAVNFPFATFQIEISEIFCCTHIFCSYKLECIWKILFYNNSNVSEIIAKFYKVVQERSDPFLGRTQKVKLAEILSKRNFFFCCEVLKQKYSIWRIFVEELCINFKNLFSMKIS